jgi:hypothetical protein
VSHDGVLCALRVRFLPSATFVARLLPSWKTGRTSSRERGFPLLPSFHWRTASWHVSFFSFHPPLERCILTLSGHLIDVGHLPPRIRSTLPARRISSSAPWASLPAESTFSRDSWNFSSIVFDGRRVAYSPSAFRGVRFLQWTPLSSSSSLSGACAKVALLCA